MYIKINDKNKVVLQLNDKFAGNQTPDNVTTFRTIQPPVTKVGEVLYFNPDTKQYYIEKLPELTEEQKADRKAKAEARGSKAKALKWLADNDWKINKRVLGEWSEEDPRWQEYIVQRVLIRAELDAAEAILNQ